MRKIWRKSVTALVAASLTVSSAFPGGIQTVSAAETVDATIRLTPSTVSVFNDTDGDGLGEFQGWGTSLCWWANRIGYSDTLTKKAAEAFFGDDGLKMNIGRYNIGGGDNVGDIEDVSVNENADIYDLSSDILPTYEGSSMKISTSNSFSSTSYSQSDADFGITAGNTVGSIKTIGWINELNADVGSGGNLHYTIPVEKSGKYTIKMLFTLTGSNSRGVSIQVTNNGTDSANAKETVSSYTVESDVVNSDIIASADNAKIYRVSFEDVELAEGDNIIDIGGNNDWCLDYIEMAVIESGKEGELPQTSDYFHATHITRSDAAVPGYATDVTKIDLDEHDKTYYKENFARADFDCGYAWNYDWDADKNQFNVLLAAAEESGDDFIAEAFSNSPPYFMTESGCSSGNTDAASDNLRSDSYTAFAHYMADVIAHWEDEGVIKFESVDAMNEPYTSYWSAYSNKQEGCHFDQGDSQSEIIVELNKALSENGINDIIISASDETSIDTAISSYKALSDEAKEIVDRIDTHTYSGSNRSGLCTTAENAGKNLWMSEVDGGSTAGTDAGEMGAALWLAERIKTDVSGLKSSAWILWNAIDAHVDESEADWSSVDYASEDELYDAIDLTGGYWGIAHADHDKEELLLTKKYYAYGQFSRYIRPGMTIIASSGDTLSAYDPENKQIVIVAINTDDDEKTWKFNLSDFKSVGKVSEVVRTSGDLISGENWADVTDSDDVRLNSQAKSFTANIKENSITTYVISGVEYDSSSEGSEESSFTESDIADNDYLLYLVDCASKDTSIVPDDYKMGLYQSATDQRVSKDAETGLKWGLAEDDDYSISVAGGSTDGTLTGTYYYTSPDISYLSGTSGFNYSFELPDRVNDDYEVTVGIKNPWSSRTVDIVIEGETVADAVTAAQSSLLEKTYTTEVKDGELNVFVHNPDRTSQYSDPVLSYIIVKAVPAYTTDSLQNLLDSQAEAMEGHEYSKATQAAYDEAAAAAKKLIGEDSSDSEAIEAAYENLTDAYDALVEVFKTEYSSITGVSADRIYDTNGVKIQAHGGQIQQFSVDGVTKYYWYGEDKTNGSYPVVGVHLYTSTDLYNWDDEGVVLKAVPVDEDAEELSTDLSVFEDNEYFKDLYSEYEGQDADDSTYDSKLEEVYWNLASDRCIMERPKVLYNDKTGKYVMWWHCDGKTPVYTSSSYAKARAGVAISDSPTGPFKYLGAYKLAYSEDADHSYDADEDELGAVRDMNLFKDDDGTAYISYSSDGNSNTYIAKLNDSYTGLIKDRDEMVLDEDFSLAFEGASREASAMFKYNGKYYMITSGCTGWAANAASYAVADDPLGPWTTIGNPFTDSSYSTSYDTQSTCVFPVDAEAGKFIYMGDRWYNPDKGYDLSDSRYVWLPVEFLSGSKIALRRYSNWTLDELENKGAFEIASDLPQTASSVDELKEILPEKVEVKLTDGSKKTYSVEWNGFDDIGEVGSYDVSGTLSNGREFSQTVNIVPDKLVYFFDCAASELDYSTDFLSKARIFLKGRLKNSTDDQKYSAENGAGYTGILKSEDSSNYDIGTKDAGESIWAHGFWAGSSKTIDYKFDLEAGDYTVYTGYQEWWSTSRPTTITVTADDAGELKSSTFTLASSDDARLEGLSFSLENADSVTVSVSKSGSADPVMSFIGLVEDSLVIEDDSQDDSEDYSKDDTQDTEDKNDDKSVDEYVDNEKETVSDNSGVEENQNETNTDEKDTDYDKNQKNTDADDKSQQDTDTDEDSSSEDANNEEKSNDNSNTVSNDAATEARDTNSPYGDEVYTDIINGVTVTVGYKTNVPYIGRKYQSAEDLGLTVSLNGHKVPTSDIKIKVSGKAEAGKEIEFSIMAIKNQAFASMWNKVSKELKAKSFESNQYAMTINESVSKKKAATSTGQVILKLGKNNKVKSAKAVVIYHTASGKKKTTVSKINKSDITVSTGTDGVTKVTFSGNYSGTLTVK